MSTNSSFNMTWQRIVSSVLAAPILFVSIAFWGYSFGDSPMDLGLNGLTSTLVCVAAGILSGIMYHNPHQPFRQNLEVRALAGAVAGACAIWAFGGYLWIRGFPENILRIELALAGILGFLPALGIYKLLAKK